MKLLYRSDSVLRPSSLREGYTSDRRGNINHAGVEERMTLHKALNLVGSEQVIRPKTL